MARREIYNTIDCKERLLLIGIEKDEYGGYKQDLLEKDLGETEIDFYVCVKCIGLMRNACLVNGPDPILVCEVCKTGEDFIPMVKARKNISRLRAKCPLMKRGCVWKGSLGEIDAHLNECAEFILNCSNVCDVLLKRSEVQNHCENECQLRIVKCKYCGATIQYKLLDNHNRICQEFPFVCPNECLKSLIRKELKSHIEKECPNTLMTCPYKEMGCEVLSKRSELPKHEKTFESKHFEKTKVFYFNKVKKMESIIQGKEDEIKQLTAKVRNMEKEYQRSKISNSPVLALTIPTRESDGIEVIENNEDSILKDEEDENCIHVGYQPDSDQGKKSKKQTIMSVKCLDCVKCDGSTEQKENAENQDLWLCMQCLFTRCGRYSTNSHSLKHYEADSRHCLTFSFNTWQIWCYKCDAFIDPKLVKGKLESVTCKAKEAAAKNLKRPKSVSDQSHIVVENKQLVDYKGSRTKSMRVIGLSNLGNTCYFNSALQNLLYLRPFRDQLIHTMTRTEYKLVPEKHPELDPITFAYINKPEKLTGELFKLMKETAYQPEAAEGSHSKKFSKKVITPRGVQNEIARKHGKFSNGSQQDSHELLRILIDMMKDEEIKRLKVAFLAHFDIKDHKTEFKTYPEDTKKLLRKYANEFKNVFVFFGTFIDDTFGGKMISTVNCLDCGNISDIDEHFLDISLALPEDNKRSKARSQPQNKKPTNKQQKQLNKAEKKNLKKKDIKQLDLQTFESLETSNTDSLEYSLRDFFSSEFLEKDYLCTFCNPCLVRSDTSTDSDEDKDEKEDSIESLDLHFSSAFKQVHIKTLPPLLTIHLKRFYQSRSHLQKVNKHIVFPLVLDMSPFCVSDTSVPRDYDNQILYGLRGIVVHSGVLVAGHNVAYVNIADWNVPAKIPSKDITKSRTAGETEEERASKEQPMDTDPAQENEDSRMPFTSENNTCEPSIQQASPSTPNSQLYEHVMPTEEWYYISDSHMSRTNHDQVFSSQAYMLFYERLPLVAKDPVL